MSLLNSYQRFEVVDFQGAQTLPEESDVPSTGALVAENTEFSPGRVGSRPAFIEIFNPRGAVTRMVNWVNSTWNRLVYWKAGAITQRNLADGVESTLFTPSSGYSFNASINGNRVYLATFGTGGVGTTEARVVQQYGAALTTDKICLGPVDATLVVTQPGAGIITEGEHLYAFLPISRTGFVGKMSPVTAGAFVPQAFTSSGTNNISVAVTPAAAWAADCQTIQAIMTTASNQGRWYIVPSSAGTVTRDVVPGFITTHTFVYSITDDDLISGAAEATLYNLFKTQDGSGNMTDFYPHCIVSYGERLTYIVDRTDTLNFTTVSECFISEPNNHQAFTVDQHRIRLPGNRKIVSAFVLNQTLYLVGPYWTYAFSDNNDVPVTWAVPRLVDGSIGTLSPTGVCENTSQGFAWVASEKGLYLFTGGSYAPLPASYLQSPTWQRINWNYAYKVQVIDDPGKKQVRVIAPLDSAVNCTHILTWDYTNGVDPSQVKFSLNAISNYNPASIALIQNEKTKKQETWIGAADASTLRHVIREADNTADTFPYTDVNTVEGNTPATVYETALMPGLDAAIGQVYAHHGAHLRVKGNGLTSVLVQGLDRVLATAAKTLSLINVPGKELLWRYILNSESVNYRLALGVMASGVCNTSGTAVTRVSGSVFDTNWGAGTKFKIGTEAATYTRSGATLTSIVVSSNVATVTIVGSHPYKPGDLVNIKGATVDADLNGIYTVQSTPSNTTFTVNTVSVTNGTYTEATLTTGAFSITEYAISSVTSASALTLTSSAGTQSSVRWYVEPWLSLSNLKHYTSAWISQR